MGVEVWVRLDLGCGNYKQPGYVGVDLDKDSSADVIGDLFALPLRDSVVDEVFCSNVIEHIPRGVYGEMWREVFRVCKPGAKLIFSFPYWTHETAIIVGHVTLLNEEQFLREEREGALFGQLFKIVSISYSWEKDFEKMPPRHREYARRHYFNVVKEMFLTFERK